MRTMYPIAAAPGYVAKYLEGSILFHLRGAGRPLMNSPASSGGEGVAAGEKLVFIYICSLTWDGHCECRLCSNFAKKIAEVQNENASDDDDGEGPEPKKEVDDAGGPNAAKDADDAGASGNTEE